MENAALYSSANGMQKKDAMEILTEFQNKIKWQSGMKILDVGCGSGEVTIEIILPHLPKDFSEFVGIDISAEMIRHARRFYSQHKVTFVQFDIAQNSDGILKKLVKSIRATRSEIVLTQEESQSEIKKIQFLEDRRIFEDDMEVESSGFDMISSFYCLHWVSNQRLAFASIYKLLKPEGEALLVFLVKSPIYTLYRAMSRSKRWKVYMQDVENFIPFYQDSKFPLKDFTKMVNNAGFLVLSSDCRKRNYEFESFSSLKNAITAVNPFLPRIPINLREDFINECLYRAKTLKLTTLIKNSYRVSYKLIIAHIRKPQRKIIIK